MQTHIKELTRWYKRKTQEQEAIYSGQYIFRTKNNINTMLKNALKKYVL